MNEILIIILVNFVLYFRTLNYGMIVDDVSRKYKLSLAKTTKQKLTVWTDVLRGSGTWKINLQLDHLLSLLLHTLVSCSIYLAFGKTAASLMAAILFSIHPANNQVSIWMNGRRYGMGTLITLGIWAFKPFGIVLYPFASLWQANALLAPILYVLTPSWRAFVLIPLYFLFWKRKMWREFKGRFFTMANGDLKKFKWKKLIIAVKTYGYYFLHCLWPRRMGFYHFFLESYGFSKEDNDYWYSLNKDFYVGLAVILIVIPTMILNWGNMIGFGLFWFTLFILQWCHFPITALQAFADRYCYLPNVGVCLAVSAAVFKLGSLWR